MTDGYSLYRAHIDELRRRYDTALAACGLDAVVIAAGIPAEVFLDDQHLPFKANPHLLQWGPLREHPGSVLIVSGGQTPRLLVYTPTDFWHRIPPVPDMFRESGLDIDEVGAAEHRLGQPEGGGGSGRVAAHRGPTT